MTLLLFIEVHDGEHCYCVLVIYITMQIIYKLQKLLFLLAFWKHLQNLWFLTLLQTRLILRTNLLQRLYLLMNQAVWHSCDLKIYFVLASMMSPIWYLLTLFDQLMRFPPCFNWAVFPGWWIVSIFYVLFIAGVGQVVLNFADIRESMFGKAHAYALWVLLIYLYWLDRRQLFMSYNLTAK